MDWQPSSWRSRPAAQAVAYRDPAHLARVTRALSASPPLVGVEECRRLRTAIARVADGKALLIQGGDCAEAFGAAREETALPTLRLLGALAANAAGATGREIVQVARMAGQFAKPRSAATETRGGATLPSWRGDIVNGSAFAAGARRPDPARMSTAYREAAATLELLRHAAPATYTSHEALLLDYEQALTREEDGRCWCLSAHMLWIGERTRQLDGAHVEYARGIANSIGLKCGPGLDPDTLLRLIERLDPANEPGRLVLIARMGAGRVAHILPPLMRATRAAGRRAIWVCDPVHGNTRREGGVKRRAMADILGEVRGFVATAAACGVVPGGLHLEMTGADVVECDGDGPSISRDYSPLSDPRLNGEQARLVVGAFAQGLSPGRRAA